SRWCCWGGVRDTACWPPRSASPAPSSTPRAVICATSGASPIGWRTATRIWAAAVAMGAWHRSTRHCPQCGGVLEPEMAGWVLRCRDDGTEHFPRTDPAVIMAVRDGRDRLLLARNAHFPRGFHSVLAGFVEPGES